MTDKHYKPLNYDQGHTLLKTEFLMGYGSVSPWEWKSNLNSWNSAFVPSNKMRLDSPLVRHVREINRFLFDGGFIFQLQQDNQSKASIELKLHLLEEVTERNKVMSMTDAILERGMATGELLFISLPSAKNFYKLKLYDRAEFYYDEERETYCIVELKSDSYYHFSELDAKEYRLYEPRSRFVVDWGKPVEVFTHGYPFIPAVKICNKLVGHGNEGIPEFDALALELANEIAAQMLNSSNNYHYFGSPLVVSPDPKTTTRELNERSQVLQGPIDPQHQPLQVLDTPRMPENHPEYLEQLNRNLAQHLGNSFVVDETPKDTAFVTLRLMYARSIDTAHKRWVNYVDYGLELLYGLVLLQSGYDGVLANVLKDEKVTIRRRQPLFEPSIQERAINISNAESLIALGVRPEIALAEVYHHKSEEEILDLLAGT